MIRKIVTNEKLFSILKTLISLLIALIITYIVLCLTTDCPTESFITMLTAPFKKLRYFSNVLETMMTLLLAALACAVLFRSGFFNLGVEGVFFACGIAVTFFATKVHISNGILHVTLTILFAALVGGILMLVSGFLKAKFDTNIVVTSLMLNSIYFGVGMWLLKTFLLGDDISITASALFDETSKLAYLFSGTRITVGFFLALLAAVVIYVLMNHTRLGYKIRITGLNSNFANYSGIKAFSLILIVHIISGILAGMGASVELLSFYDRLTWTKITAHGATGMLISMMGENKVIPVVIASFGISYLRIGAEIMSRSNGVPVELTSIVEAVLVLLISSKYFLKALREKELLKEEKENV